MLFCYVRYCKFESAHSENYYVESVMRRCMIKPTSVYLLTYLLTYLFPTSPVRHKASIICLHSRRSRARTCASPQERCNSDSSDLIVFSVVLVSVTNGFYSVGLAPRQTPNLEDQGLSFVWHLSPSNFRLNCVKQANRFTACKNLY